MPAIGPAFLHRPLPGLSALTLRHAWAWLLEGLRIAAPSRLKSFGRRPFLLLRRSDGALSLLERSVLGEMRCVPVECERGDLAFAVAAAPQDVFVASVDLPAAARRDLEEAVSHRLDHLSPLPKDEIEFAVGPVHEAGRERLEVPVAIIRKETLAALRAGENGDRISLIGFAPDGSGRFAYRFHERERADTDELRRIARLGAAIGAVILLFAGIDAGLDKRIAAAKAHEAALIETAKAEKAQFRFLEEPLAAYAPGLNGAEAQAMLAAVLAKLPAKAWIEEIAFHQGVATIRGFAPGSEAWPEGAAPSLAASDRSGVDRFSLAVGPENSHE